MLTWTNEARIIFTWLCDDWSSHFSSDSLSLKEIDLQMIDDFRETNVLVGSFYRCTLRFGSGYH